jgi:hypothetical protein|tara:strand:- start:3795 stop:3977 length:183 start_codon:yes stop_codon:yes gene_type:complete
MKDIQKGIQSDDRICLFYIADTLKDLSEIKSDKELRKKVDEFKRECIYNLGVNALHNHNN